MKRIAIVAGEVSGDYLAANLIRTLKTYDIDFEVVGICGPNMIKEGAQALYRIDHINSIGVENLLGKIFEIIRIRKNLINIFLEARPDLYIGVDAPDFNLTVEKQLRRAGIPTVQYVAPTIWAWRKYRVHKIKKAVTKLLTIFPFEGTLFRDAGVSYTYVGHPIADEIEARNSLQDRNRFGFDEVDRVIAIMAGSRMSEIKRLTPVFLETALKLSETYRNVKFISPMASKKLSQEFSIIHRNVAPSLPVQLIHRNSLEVIAAADIVLLASGTAALEAALSRKPLVVAYKVTKCSQFLVKIFGQTKHYCILNHLGNSPVIPEFMQSECTVENLYAEIRKIIEEPDYTNQMIDQFDEFMELLRRGANKRAADEVIKMLKL